MWNINTKLNPIRTKLNPLSGYNLFYLNNKYGLKNYNWIQCNYQNRGDHPSIPTCLCIALALIV